MSEDSCADCHRPTLTLITEGGIIRRLDPTPVPFGNHIIVKTGGKVRARILTGNHPPAPEGKGYRVHQCPEPEPKGPACAGCFKPMPKAVALREKWTHHPGCDPEYQQLLIEQDLPGVLPKHRKGRR